MAIARGDLLCKKKLTEREANLQTTEVDRNSLHKKRFAYPSCHEKITGGVISQCLRGNRHLLHSSLPFMEG